MTLVIRVTSSTTSCHKHAHDACELVPCSCVCFCAFNLCLKHRDDFEYYYSNIVCFEFVPVKCTVNDFSVITAQIPRVDKNVTIALVFQVPSPVIKKSASVVVGGARSA